MNRINGVCENMPGNIQLKKLRPLFKWLIALPAMLVVIIAWTATDELVAQLKLDYAALRAAEDDYRAQREINGLSGAEAADYAAYVARLQRRVFEDCQGVLVSGSPVPEDLPCPVFAPVTQSADIAMQAERTAEEQVAALDAMLMAGLGEYDERLLREQERVKAATPNTNSDSGGGAGSGGEGEGEGEGDAGGEGQAGSENSGQDSGGTAGDNRESGKSGGQQAGGPVDSSQGSGDAGRDSDQPADIPDGSDDDVVARQLREAAEKETDPELKAKLWEEYRRYKRGTN